MPIACCYLELVMSLKRRYCWTPHCQHRLQQNDWHSMLDCHAFVVPCWIEFQLNWRSWHAFFFVQDCALQRCKLEPQDVPYPNRSSSPAKITTNFPVHHIPLDGKWQHLKGLHLTGPYFKVPESINLLLVADLFGTIMRHVQRVGPPGMPSSTQTAFG